MAHIIDGKKIAGDLRAQLAVACETLNQTRGIVPGLAVVLIGNNPASEVYVRMKKKACADVGIASFSHELPADTSQETLLSLIAVLNVDPKIHGILVQLPLPHHIDAATIIQAISPEKDVDGFHPVNAGLLATGSPGLRPCTPLGIMALIENAGMDPSGKHAVIIGRSNIVGKPVALMLLQAHATVTICHSRTHHLDQVVAAGDIVVAAIGQPRFVQGDWIKKGAIVIDVGTNRLDDGSLCGDCDFASAKQRAGAISPAPGGVGPMTIAMLLANTVQAAKQS
ncbi:MAG: 5,10-methylenetetrahydrofolate dehydrogenase (NADP+) / methenyltetrahydrofolate cyclohydrolase [Magnetococcales bacterium]|nr:5,10-methylenetetrahydrofolate dehydrogenase (NADP+) / methenyltetrahydrofolate cyclohydrolase [Magnetococcales bacterium]HIJ82952.1 bifunctional methylenetetrahydrofolate dehydrogenase/methenyltetrahydrofolate cyclohydrolase FolD [Magnetococcales bacterium]